MHLVIQRSKLYSIFKKNQHHGENIFWSNLTQVILSSQFILISVLAIRFGTPSLFGEFIFVFSLFTLASVISISGVREMILRTTAQRKLGTFETATNYSFKFSLLGSLGIILLGMLFLIAGNVTYGLTLLSSSILFPFFSSLQTWQFYLKGNSEFRRLSLITIGKTASQLTVFTILLFFSETVISLFFGYIFVESIVNVFMYLAIKSELKNHSIDANWKNQSFALTYLDLAGQIFGKSDILIMGYFHSTQTVGLYGIVIKAIDMLRMVLKSTFMGILPAFYKNRLKPNSLLAFVVFSIFLATLAALFADVFLNLLYGETVAETNNYIKAFMVVIPIYAISIITDNILIKLNLNKEIVINKSITASATILLYLLLIPKWDIVGGIIASIAWFLIQITLNILALAKTRSRQR